MGKTLALSFMCFDYLDKDIDIHDIDRYSINNTVDIENTDRKIKLQKSLTCKGQIIT